jgi:hypothetical protein
MKKFLKRFGILAGLATLAIVAVTVLVVWMERWRAEHREIIVSMTGDKLYLARDKYPSM